MSMPPMSTSAAGSHATGSRPELSTLMARTQSGYELDVTKLLCLANEADIELAAEALVEGLPLAAGFANFYVIYTRADADTVAQMNVWKGRPPSQTGSIGTTTLRIPTLFDFRQLPPTLTEKRVLDVMEAFLNRGPIGFRGPAALDLPRHMTGQDGETRTAQTIVPGYRCPSNKVVARAIEQLPDRYLYITSANLSHHRTGIEEPAHWKPAPLIFDFRHIVNMQLIRHESENVAHQNYQGYAEMSTTVISFHRRAEVDGRSAFRLERYGSMDVPDVRALLERFDLGLEIAESGRDRLQQRSYDFGR
jgi:tRNA A37 threonylcarbamoyladenosine synthetase subunit TsaC/SUA5/YrdC